MRARILLVLLLLLTTACTKKEDSAAKPDSSSENVAVKSEPTAAEIAAIEAKRLADATENFQALKEELDAAMKDYTAARRKVRTREESLKLAEENPIKKLGPQFIDFANTYAGTTEALDALAMLATRGSGETKTEAINVMVKKHVDDDKIVDVVSTLSRGMPSPQNEKWIDQIIENTTTPKIEGKALVAKAGLLDGITTYKGFFASADEKQLESVDKEIVEYVSMERDANERTDLIDLMEAFVKNNLEEAKIVERELFGLKNLSINCVAPDIAGVDLDDKDFKLTDYRGKVVLLDFWGDW